MLRLVLSLLVAAGAPAEAQVEHGTSDNWLASIASGSLRDGVPSLVSPVADGHVGVPSPIDAQFVESPPASSDSSWKKWLSGYAAGVADINNSTRSGVAEAQLRVDLWKSSAWSVHFGVTSDLIFETQPTLFVDLLAGGRWAPWSTLPIWFWGEAHGLIGPTTYGMGGAGMAGIGALWKDTRLEVGAGGLWVLAGSSFDVTAQLGHVFTRWFEATLLGLYTKSSGDHLAYGLAVRLGPFSDVSVNLRWLGGQRVLALDQLGTVVEDLPDTMRDTFSASITVPVRGVSLTLGATGRWATETSGQSYSVIGAYVGVGLEF